MLLHPLIRKASVRKGMNILIIFYLMLSIAEGPVGAHSGRTVAQHSQKCQIVGQVMRLESLQAPPSATVESLAAGEETAAEEETPDQWEKRSTPALLKAAEVYAKSHPEWHSYAFVFVV